MCVSSSILNIPHTYKWVQYTEKLKTAEFRETTHQRIIIGILVVVFCGGILMNLRLDEMTPGMPACQRVYCAARARRYECKTKVPHPSDEILDCNK